VESKKRLNRKKNPLISRWFWVLTIGTFLICAFHLFCFSGIFSFWKDFSGQPLLERYFNTVQEKLSIDGGQDVGLYYYYAENTLEGNIPFRDFTPEYPPLALPFMIAPALFTSEPVGYEILFALEMTLFAVATSTIVFRFIQKRKAELLPQFTLLFLTSLLLFGHVVISRLDAVSTFFIVFTVYLILDKPLTYKAVALTSATAATGFAIKLFPVLPLIPLGVYLLYRKQWAFLATLIVTFALFSVIYWGPACIINLHGVLSSFLYHGQRGLQIESVLGLPVWITHLFTHITPVVFNYGSLNFDTPLANQIAKVGLPVFAFFTLIVAGLLAWKLWRSKSSVPVTDISAGAKASENDHKLLYFSVLLLVLGFVMLNKVFSPQYIIWIVWLLLLGLPYLPRKWFWPLVLAIQAATFVIFPIIYGDLISGYTFAVLLVIARNLSMIILFSWVIFQFAFVHAYNAGSTE